MLLAFQPLPPRMLQERAPHCEVTTSSELPTYRINLTVNESTFYVACCSSMHRMSGCHAVVEVDQQFGWYNLLLNANSARDAL